MSDFATIFLAGMAVLSVYYRMEKRYSESLQALLMVVIWLLLAHRLGLLT
jgi:hypothetical protein